MPVAVKVAPLPPTHRKTRVARVSAKRPKEAKPARDKGDDDTDVDVDDIHDDVHRVDAEVARGDVISVKAARLRATGELLAATHRACRGREDRRKGFGPCVPSTAARRRTRSVQ